MLDIQYSARFKKDYKAIQKRGYDRKRLQEVISLLAEEKPLPPKYQDHALIGNYKGCRECHIAPDWLLIYQIKDDELVLLLIRTGTHSDLFS